MSFATRIWARNLSSKVDIKNVTVVGGGLMGSGIAQVAATSGYNVTLVDVNDDVLKTAILSITKNLNRVAKKQFKDNESEQTSFVQAALQRLNTSVDVHRSVENTDLVIEAIVEVMSAKHKLFTTIDKIAPKHTLFASNTSSLAITEIASSTSRGDRFGGLHFFNPAPMMKLLEVVRTDATSDETYASFLQFGKQLGKACVSCKDTPGFIVNRLLIPFAAEAFRLLERGDASARDIDTALKLGAGFPMGPIELSDYAGLDITQKALQGWHAKYPENPLFNPVAKLDELVNAGKLGVKTGEGFYSYKK